MEYAPTYNPRVPVDAAVAARAFIDSWLYLASSVPGGWTRAKGAGLAGVTGVAVPSLNGVWVQTVDPDLGDINHLPDQVAATGCLTVCSSAQVRSHDLHSWRA